MPPSLLLDQARKITHALYSSNIQSNDDQKSFFSLVEDSLHLLKDISGELCASVEDSFLAQQQGQLIWNKITENNFTMQLNCKLRASLCHLSTLLYLNGSNFFAKEQMQSAYYQSHPLESEKCVLLCLKTANLFSEIRDSSTASQLLSYAHTIRSKCFWPTSKSSQFDLELLFAEMAICKDMENWIEVVRIANIIAKQCDARPSQREALLHFIFLAGESSTIEPASETFLRQLLQISIDVQMKKHTNLNNIRKENALLGATHLQISLSFFRCSRFEEAVEFANSAFTDLASPEILILKAISYSFLGRTGDATSTFSSFADTETIPLDDLFSMAFVISEVDKQSIPYIYNVLRTMHHETTSEEFVFFLLSYCAHFPAQLKFDDLLDVIDRAPRAGKFSYALFVLLWDMGQNNSLPVTEQFQVMQRCLNFSDFVGKDEKECAVTMMGKMAIQAFQQTGCLEMVQVSYEYQLQLPELCLFSKVVRCKLAFLLNSEDLDATLDDLVRCEEKSEIPTGCAALILFFMQHDSLQFAARVARLGMPFTEKSIDQRVAFLKIIGLSLIHSGDTTLDNADMLLLTELFPLLINSEPIKCDKLWWSRLFWYISDSVSDASVVLSVQLSALGLDVLLTDSEVQINNNALKHRLLLVLDSEFDLFSHGIPALSPPQLLLYQSYLRKFESSNCSTFFLSHCEHELRTYSKNSEDGVDSVRHLLTPSNLSLYHCSFEDAEALTFSLIESLKQDDDMELRQLCANIILFAVQHLRSKEIQSCVLVRSFYTAYTIAPHILIHEQVCRHFLEFMKRDFSNFSNSNSSIVNSVESIIEFFSVESWNSAVKYNTTKDPVKVELWKNYTSNFLSFLPDGNYTRDILNNFLAEMPVISSS